MFTKATTHHDTPQTLSTWVESFRNPPASCRPQLQWSWNGRLSAERIAKDLRDYRDKGIGGFFMHARPGMEHGYIEEEWFTFWKVAADECRRLGLEWHLYDEYTCPGGVAGGHTVATAPHTAATILRVLPVNDPQQLPAGEVLAWLERNDPHGPLRRVNDVSLKRWQPGRSLFAAVIAHPPMNASKAAFPKPDLTHPDTTRAFLQTTHERYLATSGEHFGSTTRYCFCDEPALYQRGGILMSRRILEAFFRQHGYRIEDRLEDLWFTTERSPEVRYAYWSTLHTLWQQNFMQPMFQWCEDHQLEFTGHFMENRWPSPQSNPDCMASYRWMQAPGNDLLGFQFDLANLRANGLYLLNLKELTSAAAQLGRQHVMVESSGAAGYDASYPLFKSCEDFLLAFGVNVMDPHLSHWSLAGARKYDWAQTLSPHSPWWECYKTHADHVARVIAAQREGAEVNRVLVLHPTLTGWLHAAADQPDAADGAEESLLRLRKIMTDFLVLLTGNQIDYDLGDEWLLEEFGRAEGKSITMGERRYDVVLLPPGMETWRASTLDLIEAYLRNGGLLLAAGAPPTRLDGHLSEAPARLRQEHLTQWLHDADPDSFVETLRQRIPPRITAPDGAPLPEDLVWRRTLLSDGDILWWFCSPWNHAIDATVQFDDPRGTWMNLDTASGAMERMETPRDSLTLQLPARGHRLLLQQRDRSPSAVIPPDQPPFHKVTDLRFLEARRQEPNLCLLDYASAWEQGAWQPARCTYHLDQQHWRRHGCDQNPWSMSHPYRRTLIDRQFESTAPHRMRFTCFIDLPDERLRTVELGMERPWLYHVEVNGRPLPGERFVPWFDEEFGSAGIGDLLQQGSNEMELIIPKMSALVEIMPVYLRGDFAVQPTAPGFRIEAPEPIGIGDWRTFGLPFYRGWVGYRYTFELEKTVERISIPLPEWKGGALRAAIDGDDFQPILHPPFIAHFEQKIGPGTHQLHLEVASTLYNMIGPHHSNGLSGPWSWDAAPKAQPDGKNYLLRPAGLFSD